MTRGIQTLIMSCLPEKHAWKITIFSSWDQIMGRLSSTIQIHTIRGSQLTLSAPHSCWIAELHAMSQTILNRVNTFLKEQRIERLRYIVRGTRTQIKPLDQAHSAAQSTERVVAEAEPMPQSLVMALTQCADTGMRQALEQYWQRCVAQSKNKDK